MGFSTWGSFFLGSPSIFCFLIYSCFFFSSFINLSWFLKVYSLNSFTKSSSLAELLSNYFGCLFISDSFRAFDAAGHFKVWFSSCFRDWLLLWLLLPLLWSKLSVRLILSGCWGSSWMRQLPLQYFNESELVMRVRWFFWISWGFFPATVWVFPRRGSSRRLFDWQSWIIFIS